MCGCLRNWVFTSTLLPPLRILRWRVFLWRSITLESRMSGLKSAQMIASTKRRFWFWWTKFFLLMQFPETSSRFRQAYVKSASRSVWRRREEGGLGVRRTLRHPCYERQDIRNTMIAPNQLRRAYDWPETSQISLSSSEFPVLPDYRLNVFQSASDKQIAVALCGPLKLGLVQSMKTINFGAIELFWANYRQSSKNYRQSSKCEAAKWAFCRIKIRL